MTEKPAKQFYNRKTKKYHVFYETGDENQPLKIREVLDEPADGVPLCGNLAPTPDESQRPPFTLSKPEQNEADDEAAADDKGKDKPDETDAGNSSGGGFFNFF